MAKQDTFDLVDFLPYLLNQAADRLGLEFQTIYKSRYGMLRTEWRVLFHLGRYGDMTAKEVCDRGHLHKTKVSRAVHALEQKRFLKRTTLDRDRRHETLALTSNGQSAYRDLSARAQAYDDQVRARMSDDEARVLLNCLRRIADLPEASQPPSA